MAKVNFLGFMIIGGARYEKVETEFFAYNAKDARNARQQVMYDTTAFEENEFILPMAQMKYSPLDWLDIRYAYTQTLARPDYHLLSPKFTIIDLSREIRTGNPQLEPAKAFNHDVSVTVHNNEIGLFSVGGFYKTIENFIYNATYQLEAAQNVGVDNVNRYTIVRDGVAVVAPAGANYTVYRPLNNPYDATVKGLEFDLQHSFWYLPRPLNNLVFGINYARIYSETTYPWYYVRTVVVPPRGTRPELVDSTTSGRLIDQPDHVLNTYIGYDYEGFSSRLSFLYQDNTYTSTQGRDIELDSFSKEYFRVDFSARQKLPWYNTEVFLDVKNMNNANTRSIQRSFEGFRNIQNYGLVVNLGIRVTY
jgi:TonB-dependent receptor